MFSVLGVTGSKRQSFHSTLSSDLLVSEGETAGKVSVLGELFLVVVGPIEVSIDKKRDLHVTGHRVSVDTLVLRVVDVEYFNLVLSVAGSVDADFNRHCVFSDVCSILIIDHALWKTLSCDGVLVNELGGSDTGSVAVADKFSLSLSAELGVNLTIA